MSKRTLISWDLGATKCGAAIVAYDSHREDFSCEKTFAIRLTECGSIDELVEAIEVGLGMKMADADAICIGASGDYTGTELYHEVGYPYKMDFARVINEYHWPETAIIHDYAPIICATFTSYMKKPENIRILQQGEMNQYGRRVTFGVGTGLGMKDGLLFPSGEFWFGSNEVGYTGISMPPAADDLYVKRHYELIKFMGMEGVLGKDKLISYENILSGRGMVLLHKFVNSDHTHITPEELGQQMRSGEADETREIFAWYLGLFIGTVQLTMMPSGGVWITGGVLLKHPKVFDSPELFSGIAASPSYWKQRQKFPLGVMINPNHAYIGAAYYAVKRLL